MQCVRMFLLNFMHFVKSDHFETLSDITFLMIRKSIKNKVRLCDVARMCLISMVHSLRHFQVSFGTVHVNFAMKDADVRSQIMASRGMPGSC